MEQQNVTTTAAEINNATTDDAAERALDTVMHACNEIGTLANLIAAAENGLDEEDRHSIARMLRRAANTAFEAAASRLDAC